MSRADVIVRFGADVSALNKSVSKMRRGFKALASAAGGFVGVLSVGALAGAVRNVTQFADTLVNTSERVGQSIERVQALRLESEKLGLSYSQTDTALQRFSRRLGEAQQGTGTLLKVLQQYNVTVRETDGTMRSTQAVFDDFAAVLREIEGDAERNRVAMAAFDSEGVKLGQTLATLDGTLDETTASLLEQAAIMEGESVRAAAAFETRWTEAVQKANNIWRQFVVNVIDGWSKILRGFGDVTDSIAGTTQINAKIYDTKQRYKELTAEVEKNSGSVGKLIGAHERSSASLLKTAQKLGKYEREKQQLILQTVALRKAEAAVAGLTPPGEISAGGGGGSRGGGGGAVGRAKAASKAIKQATKDIDDMDAHVRKFEETQAKAAEEMQRSWESIGDSATNALGQMITDGKKASDVLKQLAADILNVLAEKVLIPSIVEGLGFAKGGVMSGSGEVPLRKYATGGVAQSPQLAMFGEGSGAEAFVPLPDGRRIPVDMQGAGQNVVVNQAFDFSGANPATALLLRQEAGRIVEASKQAVLSAIEQGGTYAHAVGRR